MRAAASHSLTPIPSSAGVIISLRDITTEKKFEQQVVQSERLAAMGAMIGGVAHELNNPLTSILGVSDSYRIVRPRMRRESKLPYCSSKRGARPRLFTT